MADAILSKVVDTLIRSFDHVTSVEEVPPGYKESFRVEIRGKTVRGTLGL